MRFYGSIAGEGDLAGPGGLRPTGSWRIPYASLPILVDVFLAQLKVRP